MKKTQAKFGDARRAIRRAKRNVQACLGVMCAAMLVVAALPSASTAVGETAASEGAGAPPAIEASADPSLPKATKPDHVEQEPVETGEGSGPVETPAPEASSTLPQSTSPLDADAPDGAADESPQDGQVELGSNPLPEGQDSHEPKPSPSAVEEANALAVASRATGDPAGFSWTFADIDAATCKITGYTGGSITSGTVHVPAANPAGKKVVSIAGKGSAGTFKNLKCAIDFSAAVNLQRIDQFAFAEAGLQGAFDLSKCTKLTEIKQYAFKDSLSITSVSLPPSLTSIENYAFMGDTGIKGTLALPASLGKLGDYAFASCKLDKLSISPDIALVSFGKNAFSDNNIAGALTFPASIASFGYQAFANNKITAVTFQTSAPRVAEKAFYHNLIANDPISGTTFGLLGSYAFASNSLSGQISFEKDQTSVPSAGVVADNPAITGVTLSRYWIVVPAEMFKGLTQLTSVSFPEGNRVTRIGDRAFQACTSISSIDFNNAPLADSSANGVAIGVQAFQGCSSLREVLVGNGVFDQQNTVTLTVANSAFKDCTALSFLDIPQPVSGTTKFNVNIGDKAFMNTNLGAFPVPGSVTSSNPAGTPLGYLPLDRRNVLKIGESAFENANLTDVRLPDTLGFVGSRAFANNHMTGLELPQNANLDKQGNVGTDVLAGQTVDSPAVWGDSSQAGKADIILEALHALGLVHERVDSVGLNVPNVGTGLAPDNASTWKSDHVATYDKSYVETTGATFTYGYEVWRTGGSGALSHGTVELRSLDKGVPFTFHYYDNADFSGTAETHVQWVGVGYFPVETAHGIANFGLNKPGYHTRAGAYASAANAGWRAGAGPGGSGAAVDPETVKAVDREAPQFYNRWLANSYGVEFDDNWDSMVTQDASLGMVDPAGSGATVRNPEHVSGTTADLPGLAYGESAALPENGFRMGGYAFVGWATSPDLAEANRAEGSNFFPPGVAISTPDPAPADGGTVTLYAQWKAVDYGADDPALLGFLSIPQNIELQPDGDKLWSKPPGSNPQPGDHAVPIVAAEEAPGATWPVGKEYRVSVTRPSIGAPLLELSGDGGPGKEIQVLKSDRAPYDPGATSPGALPDPLVVIDPEDPSKKAGSFMLRSVDSVSAFKANVRYAGTMTFRVDVVEKGVAP